MPGRPRIHRLLITSILAVLLLVAGSTAIVQQCATATRTAMLQKIDTLEKEWQEKDHRREPLYGAGTEGLAFAGYAAALELAKHLHGDTAALVGTLPHCDDGRVAGKEALRDRWRPAIDLLRDAAHRTDARPIEVQVEVPMDDPGHRIVGLLDSRWLVNMAVFEARALRLAGQPRAAVERTLDAATLGRDLVHSGVLVNQMIGAALVAIAADEAWPDPALRQLDKDALDMLATGLERLDRSLPTNLDLDGELRFLGKALQDSPTAGVQGFATGTWRYGFSAQWMVADGFLSLAAAGERVGAEQRLSWPQREAWLRLEFGAVADSGNPISAVFAPNLTSAEQSLRQVATLVRLLRMAVDVHRGVDATPLQDPLGCGPFRVTREADRITFESAGARGERTLDRCVRR